MSTKHVIFSKYRPIQTSNKVNIIKILPSILKMMVLKNHVHTFFKSHYFSSDPRLINYFFVQTLVLAIIFTFRPSFFALFHTQTLKGCKNHEKSWFLHVFIPFLSMSRPFMLLICPLPTFASTTPFDVKQGLITSEKLNKVATKLNFLSLFDEIRPYLTLASGVLPTFARKSG